MPSKNLQAALYYLEKLEFSVIPSARETKKPLINWRPYQERKATRAEVEGWWQKWPDANISIVTGAISGIVVVDVDSEKGQEHVNQYFPDSLITPTASTPRGGHHYYFKHNGKTAITKADIFSNNSGVDIRGDGGLIIAAPSERKEGKYTWDNGLRIGDVELPYLPDAFYEIANGQKRTSVESNGQVPDENGHIMFVEGRRDEDIFHVACLLLKGGAFKAEVEQTIHKIALSCGFPEVEARLKVQSAIERMDKNGRNLQGEVRDFVDFSNGTFDLSHIYINLNLKERKDKKNVSEALRKLCNEGIIEKSGNKNGQYRKVDNTVEVIDFMNADDSEFEIALPMGINTFVKIQPKNIIVVAGSPNSGKTALLLNIAHDNLAKHRVEYFSSEMGAAELKSRLVQFDEPLEYWKGFKPKERADNFADVIVPDAINIIDFLELTEDFYLVGRYMRDIFNKLTTGIAIVALQKAPGASMGRGGVGSLEKPRLYLTMESNKIQIVKGKNWRYPYQNPNGMEREFRLVNGCKFMPEKGWELAEEKPTFRKER